MQDISKIDMLFEQREKIEWIEKTLKTLKEEDLQIFYFYYYLGKTNKEIGEQLNISEFAVKQKLYRIRQKIKKDLKKGGYSLDEFSK